MKFYQSAIELSRDIKSLDVSCQSVMDSYLNRIETLNPEYNAIVDLAPKSTLMAQAKIADDDLRRGIHRGWMHGMPHAVKDLANVEGFITSYGSPLFKQNHAKSDELFVQRLRQSGAIFIGKTNVPEFGLGSQSYNNVYGATGCAFNSETTAGGSSGGAAVALALNLVPVADGSDMMGSLRNPAAYNNVVGFRPSLGRVPALGDEVFYAQLATNGPMGRSVDDVAALFAVMQGADVASPLSMLGGNQVSLKREPEKKSGKSKAAWKVAWLADNNAYLPMEDGIVSHCESSLSRLAANNIEVGNQVLDFDMNSLWRSWLVLRQWYMAGSRRAMYNNVEHRELMKPELLWEIESGLGLTAADVYDAALVRSSWYQAVSKLFQHYDVVAWPAAQVYSFDINSHWPEKIGDVVMDTYHRWMEVTIGATMASCPTISLPAGVNANRQPMGIQFMGAIGSDDKLLRFSRTYEKINPWKDLYSL